MIDNVKRNGIVARVLMLKGEKGAKGDRGDINIDGTTFSLPVSVANGGTGASTAEGARDNMGLGNVIEQLAGTADSGLKTLVDANSASISSIQNCRTDSYNPNTSMTLYCSIDNAWAANDEYMQGCTICNNTLYVCAAPVSGTGNGSVYRYPNYSSPTDGKLIHDARLHLKNCAHPNDLAPYNGVLFVVDGYANRHITAIDISTFTELAGIDLAWGGITDICIHELKASGTKACIAFIGSLVDANRVLSAYCVYDKSTNTASDFSYKTTPQLQNVNLRQGATMYGNTRFMVYSCKPVDEAGLYRNGSYIAAGSPYEGATYSIIPIPYMPYREVEGCFIDANENLCVNCSGNICILGPVQYFMNQAIEPALGNRGSSSAEFVPAQNLLANATELVNQRALLGYRFMSKLVNNSVYNCSIRISFKEHNPIIMPVEFDGDSGMGSAVWHSNSGWCRAYLYGNIVNLIEGDDIECQAFIIRAFNLDIAGTLYTGLASLPEEYAVRNAIFKISIAN